MNMSLPYRPLPRVALFSGNYNYIRDGANQALNRLVAYLERQGVPVRVYSPTARQPAFAHAGKVVSVPSFAIPRREEYRFAYRFPEEVQADLAQFRPNLFHLSAPDYLGYRAMRLAQARGIPVVASVHTRFETYFKYYRMAWCEKYVRAYLRYFYRQCAQIYAPTPSMAQVLRDEDMGDDVRIWSRGVDSKLFDPGKRSLEWRRAHGFDDDDFVIAFVGRLVLEKGLAVFAETVAALESWPRPPRVVVVGDGPERAWFAERMPDAVFTGHLEGEALARAYASVDVFLNPSTTETFGNVTLEAMASGLSVIGAKATGSVSLVEEGVTGLLASHNVAAEYAIHLTRLAGDPDLRAQFAHAGRHHSLAYNWDQVLGGVLRNYREVLEARMAQHTSDEQPAVVPA